MASFFAAVKTESQSPDPNRRTRVRPEEEKMRDRLSSRESKRFHRFWNKILIIPKYKENPNFYNNIKAQALTTARGKGAKEKRRVAREKLYSYFPEFVTWDRYENASSSAQDAGTNESIPDTPTSASVGSGAHEASANNAGNGESTSDDNVSKEVLKRRKKQSEYTQFRAFWREVIKTEKYKKNPEHFDALKAEATKTGGSNSQRRQKARDALYSIFPECCPRDLDELIEAAKNPGQVDSPAAPPSPVTQKHEAAGKGEENDNATTSVVSNNPSIAQEQEVELEKREKKKQKKTKKKRKKKRKRDDDSRTSTDEEERKSYVVASDRHVSNDGEDDNEDDGESDEDSVDVADLLNVQYRLYRKNKSSKGSRESFKKNITRILAIAKDDGFPLGSLDSMSSSDAAAFVSERLADVELEAKVYMGILKMFSKGLKT